MSMKCRCRIEDCLTANKVAFQPHHHPPAYTARELAAAQHLTGTKLVKVVMVMADRNLVMLALPAPYMVDLKRATTMLGAQEVRLASEQEFASAFPDCEVGATPPFGCLYDLPLYVDKTVAENETIVFRAGTHTDTISMKYDHFYKVARPEIGDFARHQ